MKIARLPDNPIIHPGLQRGIGENINGPSLIRVPAWLKNPLGKYYLYFAHHKGLFIRLAYADRLEGPWRIYEPGTLTLENSRFLNHIASPDVHIDDRNREIRMYYHGQTAEGGQGTGVAISQDGITFNPLSTRLGNPYFRVFQWQGYYYALGMPGVFYRSVNGLNDFERGPQLFSKDMRHSAVMISGNQLRVFYSNVGDVPERILLSRIELTTNWLDWQVSTTVVLLEPELEYEGVNLPLEPSVRDWAPRPVRQLRDPAIFQDKGKTFLLYSIAGEQGIGIARIVE